MIFRFNEIAVGLDSNVQIMWRSIVGSISSDNENLDVLVALDSCMQEICIAPMFLLCWTRNDFVEGRIVLLNSMDKLVIGKILMDHWKHECGALASILDEISERPSETWSPPAYILDLMVRSTAFHSNTSFTLRSHRSTWRH